MDKFKILYLIYSLTCLGIAGYMLLLPSPNSSNPETIPAGLIEIPILLAMGITYFLFYANIFKSNKSSETSLIFLLIFTALALASFAFYGPYAGFVIIVPAMILIPIACYLIVKGAIISIKQNGFNN